jgi:hypothetical protein
MVANVVTTIRNYDTSLGQALALLDESHVRGERAGRQAAEGG